MRERERQWKRIKKEGLYLLDQLHTPPHTHTHTHTQCFVCVHFVGRLILTYIIIDVLIPYVGDNTDRDFL